MLIHRHSRAECKLISVIRTINVCKVNRGKGVKGRLYSLMNVDKSLNGLPFNCFAFHLHRLGNSQSTEATKTKCSDMAEQALQHTRSWRGYWVSHWSGHGCYRSQCTGEKQKHWGRMIKRHSYGAQTSWRRKFSKWLLYKSNHFPNTYHTTDIHLDILQVFKPS